MRFFHLYPSIAATSWSYCASDSTSSPAYIRGFSDMCSSRAPALSGMSLQARQLILSDRIMVGSRPAQLAAIRQTRETVSLFNIQFNPDGAVEAYVLPEYGIHVRGVQQNTDLFTAFQQIPAENLMRAMPLQYDD